MELITLASVSVTMTSVEGLSSDDLVAMEASEASNSNRDNCWAAATSLVLYLESEKETIIGPDKENF